MLKRTEPALTEITQYITIERTVGVGPELVAVVHDARSEKKLRRFISVVRPNPARGLADQIGD